MMPNALQSSGTPEFKIILSDHNDKFSECSQELTIKKKVNFIFGRNGTGKTTISDEIMAQLSTYYDVCLFKDFDGVVENERLNAVALGTENTKIQKEIDILDSEIDEIRKQIVKPEERNVENLFTNDTKAKETYYKQDRRVEDFFKNSARKIKNISRPQIAKPTYNKTDFFDDISKANLLSKDSIMEYKNTIKADKKAKVTNFTFPAIDLSSYLESTNNVLQSWVSQTQHIPELEGKIDKQNFARQGMQIHQHIIGEICAFCGNKISDERWELLGNYFNYEVKKMENSIASKIAEIDQELDSLKDIKEIKEEEFYDKFKQDVKNLNLQIKVKRNTYKEFLETLKKALEEKKSHLFVKSVPLEIVVPENFRHLENECKGLVENNNMLSLHLETEQEKAKDALRYHETKLLIDEFKYYDEKTNLERLKDSKNNVQNVLSKKMDELQLKQDKRKELIVKTKDEYKIAIKINNVLKNMGVKSFSLELIKDDDENQKGQYQIKSYNGNIRPITQLSKGEKNIIAFLYFIFSLESVDSKSKPKIIVMDDPMTSNDDTMQYLMISEIQKLYRKLNNGNFMILLTHNCHFYLNVRPNTNKTYKENGKDISFYEKYGVYHLLSDGKRTVIINIEKGKQDFKTSYETLWKELVFLYNTEDATPDLMLGSCRKICETYMNFTKRGIEAFYGDSLSAKKLFDVNLHSIGDFEAEAIGKTKSEIIDILRNLFSDNNAEDHFNSYWQGGEL